MKTIGLFGGAFKPFHVGHYLALKKVSSETDRVFLFISNKDRINKNEFPITWNKMEQIWNKYIVSILPNNINIIIVDNPTTHIFDFLSKAEINTNDYNIYNIYSSTEDLEKTYSDKKLLRLYPKLSFENQIEKKETNTRNIVSGKHMRLFLQNNDIVNFTKFLPEPIQRYGMEIFTLLKN